MQDDAPASVTALAQFLGLCGFAKREYLAYNGHYLAFVDQLREGIQEFGIGLC